MRKVGKRHTIGIDRISKLVGVRKIEGAQTPDAPINFSVQIVDVVDDVTFRSASGTDIEASSTTVSSTIPGDVEPGDFLILHVMHRDTLATPSGWTVLEGPTVPVSFNQMQTVLYRIAESGDAGSVVQLAQATAQRFISHIQAYQSNSTINLKNGAINQTTTGGLTLPGLTSTRTNQMAVGSMTFVLAQTSGGDTMIPPEGFTLTSVEFALNNRLGAAYKILANEETISGAFNQQETANDNETAFSALLDSEESTVARCTWSEVVGVDGYNVYLKNNGEFEKQNNILIDALQFDIEGLLNGEYQAYATSVINDTESAPSNIIIFVKG